MPNPPAHKYRGTGRVTFLACLEAIEAKVKEGWPIKAIYDQYAHELGITYIQFTRYVRRYVRKDPKSSENSANALGITYSQFVRYLRRYLKEKDHEKPQSPAPTSPTPPGTGLPQFRYDPKWADKDKLI